MVIFQRECTIKSTPPFRCSCAPLQSYPEIGDLIFAVCICIINMLPGIKQMNCNNYNTSRNSIRSCFNASSSALIFIRAREKWKCAIRIAIAIAIGWCLETRCFEEGIKNSIVRRMSTNECKSCANKCKSN